MTPNDSFPKTIPAVPNDLHADSRTLCDAALWAGLDLGLPALRPVRAALGRRKEEQARAALVAHFRRRRKPRITKYRTDPHWSDWEGGPTLIERADMLAQFTAVEANRGPEALSRNGRIDWDAALQFEHEICRLGAMATLAEAWARTESQAYATAMRTWMESYWRELPFLLDPCFHREEFQFFGGPAHLQLNSCYILFHWADILDSPLMRTSGVLPDSFWFEFIRQFWFLAFQFTRFLGSSWRADNHHLMQRGTGCYFLGVGYPEFRRAKEMESFGRWNIQRHFDHNLLADNTGSEACTQYQYRCFIRYALPDSMARLNGRSLLGKAREKKLGDWLDFQGYMTAPDGRMPDTGDGAAPTLAAICEESGALYRSPLLKGIVRSLKQERSVNPAFQSGWDRTPSRPPRTLSRIYPNGGHLVLRDSWRPDAHWLWLGIKNDSLYDIHQHWNTFDFSLSAFGRRLIGSPICRTYGCSACPAHSSDAAQRGYFFSMDAHNTLVIDHDNLKSHEALGHGWGRQPPRITVAAACLDAAGGFDYASFRHDGYRPLLHRRDVFFMRGRYFLMTDVITMDFAGLNTVFASAGDIRPHHYRQRLHFETGVTARPLSGRPGLDARAGDGPGMLIVPEPFENLAMTEGPNSYLDGLNEPGFRNYRVADIVRQTIGASIFSTVYFPHDGRQVPDVQVTALTPRRTAYRDDRHHAILIEDGRHKDLWLIQRDIAKPESVTVAADGLEIQTNAAVLFLSWRGRELVRAFQIGGRAPRVNGKPLTIRPSPLVWHKRPSAHLSV